MPLLKFQPSYYGCITYLLQGYKNKRKIILANGTELWTVPVANLIVCTHSLHECEMFWIWHYLFIDYLALPSASDVYRVEWGPDSEHKKNGCGLEDNGVYWDPIPDFASTIWRKQPRPKISAYAGPGTSKVQVCISVINNPKSLLDSLFK